MTTPFRRVSACLLGAALLASVAADPALGQGGVVGSSPGGLTPNSSEAAPAGGGTTLHVRHDDVAAQRADWLDGRWTGMLYGLGEALDCDSHELSHDLESQ